MESFLEDKIKNILIKFYSNDKIQIQLQKTRREFDGDLTLVVFPLINYSGKNLIDTANEIGNHLEINVKEINKFNVVKGFLNLSISSKYWLDRFIKLYSIKNYGFIAPDNNSPTYLIEYCSPNTNKPLHLGHIRNNLLGYSMSKILEASGKKVKKVQIINDRGIHICKSMVAWKKFANGETPQSSGTKGDHFVGKYYVKFDQQYKKEIAELIKSGIDKDTAMKESPIFKEAKKMLLLWEANDFDAISLWKKMNKWVYDGFSMTNKRLGIDFDKNYYESDTYILGKKIVDIGLKDGVFYKKEDDSVWVDLTKKGLDHKIILRSDGTAVYMTQDLGTAIQRHKDFNFSNMIYTVGNEQDYHFKVLFLILDELGYKWAKNCYHLSYGMVDLPSGKMKSREGTVVDADDLMQSMVDDSKRISKELGKLEGFCEKELEELYEIIGIGALKYFILKVDSKKRMMFNPEESIDFNGNTGPFIQYTYARIQSILRKYNSDINDINDMNDMNDIELNKYEIDIIKYILEFPNVIKDSCYSYSPSIIANYVYELVKKYNSFYQNSIILSSGDKITEKFRVSLSKKVSEIIKSAMSLLGIRVPNRM